MELVYSMRRKPLKCEPPHYERSTDPEVVRPICTISCCNIIAFSSLTELSDVEGDTWGGHVYVCDLDTPWDSHKVVSTIHPVSALEWDGEGKQLLVGTTEGEVSVYGQKDFLLNDWTCLYSATFPGERIVKGIFFSSGRRLVVVDKKHDAPIAERIQALRPTPTLKGFGGVWTEGACVVSGSGLVCALTAQARASHSLRAHRDRVTRAALAHNAGSILVAAVCGGGGWLVRCAVCSVTGAGAAAGPLALQLRPLPTITCAQPPSALSWCVRGEAEWLLLGGGSLALWRLADRAQPVHSLLAAGAGSSTPSGVGAQKPASDCFNTLVWQQAGGWSVECARCSSVCSSSCSAPHVLLAAGNRLLLLARDSHHVICARTLNTGGTEPSSATPPKKSKYGNGTLTNSGGGAMLSCVDMSRLGGAAVCIDSRSQLHVLRLLPAQDIPTPLAVQHVTALLEYSLVSGYDCLDVLFTLKHNLVEAVYERITEIFQRQPPAFQQFYYHTWLKMRIALCRMLPTGAVSVSWLTSLCSASALWAACGGALRPDDRDDKLLAALLDDCHPDHDKALVTLEGKAETVGDPAALAALRRPLQRVLHIALTALAAAAHAHAQPYSLCADASAVSLLRRLCVVARGAGAEPALGRLLARLHLPLKPDLIEECAALGGAWAARVWEALPRTAVSAPHSHAYPLYLEYGVEPEWLRVRPEPPAWLADAAPQTDMDSIRYMYLGLAARWRQCGRCGARALAHAQPARHPLQRAHDARMLPACRCGGKWTLVSTI